MMLGDEMANTLGLRVERFRLFLIAASSLLAGTSIAVAGMISFVGLIVPHIARLLIGSDYKYLFPASFPPQLPLSPRPSLLLDDLS